MIDPRGALRRWALLCGVAFGWGVLPWLWCRMPGLVLARFWVFSRQTWLLVAGVLLLVLVQAVARRLGARFRWSAAQSAGLVIAWISTTTIYWFAQRNALAGDPWVAPVTAVAGLWILGVWMLLIRARHTWPRAGWVVLASFLALASLAALELENLDGAGQPILRVAWRRAQPLSSESPSQAASSSADALIADGPNLPQPLSSVDFAEYRGPGRIGSLPDMQLVTDWQTHAPRELWRRPVGAGWGGFAVAGNLAFTQEQQGAHECVTAYELSTGIPVWRHVDRAQFSSSMGGEGPRATPTVDESHVYTLGATGILNCLERATGRLIWTVNILADNDAQSLAPYHGMCSSPLLVDELVVVSAGGAEGKSLVAYDRHTGQRNWRGGSDPAGYGSAQLIALDGVRQIAILNRNGISSHDLADGHVLWSFPWENSTGTNCSQPLVTTDGNVLLTSGYGLGATLLKVTHDEERWNATPLWESRDLKTKFTSAVIHDGFAYGLDDGILACIDLTNGRRRWKSGRYGHGQILLVGDTILVQTEAGELVLVAAEPKKLRELARIPALSSKTWNNPALAGHRLLVRNDREAICYELELAPVAE
jgi:outer membrane protein assembly factor BamB